MLFIHHREHLFQDQWPTQSWETPDERLFLPHCQGRIQRNVGGQMRQGETPLSFALDKNIDKSIHSSRRGAVAHWPPRASPLDGTSKFANLTKPNICEAFFADNDVLREPVKVRENKLILKLKTRLQSDIAHAHWCKATKYFYLSRLLE